MREEGFSRVVAIDADPELCALRRREGLDRARRRQPDRRALRDGRLRDRADPRDAQARRSAGSCPGSAVNVEVDILAKHLERLCWTHPKGMSAMSQPSRPFATIEEAIEEIRAGRMVVVCDDEDRENEGDLVMAAQFVTPEAINFMAKEARGCICLALTPERCEQLGLDLMTAKNESPLQTPFTVTIEAREGVTTGVSAHDRAHTIQVAVDPGSGPGDLVQPGHVNPLKAKAGGVLERTGHTEASVDLARLAGLIPAGVICEIMNDDGSMARVPDLAELLRAARAEDGHDRGPDRLPAAQRQARRARRRDAAADRVRRSSRRSATARWSTTSTTSRSSRARSPATPTCSCACTRSASPATSSTRCAATAAGSSTRRWR